MMDYNQLYADFKKWYMKLKYYCKGHTLDYITVAEPQGRGAWHMHVMLKSDKFLFLDNQTVIAPMWGHGMTDTQRLKSDDVGRYYVAYFTDLFGEFGTTAQKKGGRLPLYPVGMKFYRCSRGIKRPERVNETFGETKDRGGEVTYHSSYKVIDEETDEVVQIVHKEHRKISKRDKIK
jgi:hypothetical protein